MRRQRAAEREAKAAAQRKADEVRLCCCVAKPQARFVVHGVRLSALLQRVTMPLSSLLAHARLARECMLWQSRPQSRMQARTAVMTAG